MRRTPWWLLPFSACAALLAGGAAVAANLQISPVNIVFQPGQSAAGVTMQNFGDTPLYGQVRVYAWDQRDGDDVLTPATQLVASPPIIQIPPKGAQVVRLILRSAQPSGAQQTFRVLIDEIAKENGPASGVDIRLRYSVPVFIMPADPKAAPQLDWQFKRKGEQWTLRLHNSGTLHAQVGATTVRAGGKTYTLSGGLLGYALAGRTREWTLAVDKAADLGGTVSIESTINARPLTASAGP